MYSLQTRMKALAIAGVMAASVAGSTVSAFAAVSDDKQLTSVSIIKNVYYPAQGVTPKMPDEVTSFGFTATFESSSLVKNANGTENRGTAPQTFTATVNPGNWTDAGNGTWSSTGILKATGNGNETFSWDNVTPGEYVYTLTENKMTIGEKETYESKDTYGYGWTFNKDNTSYKLRVYVSAKATTDADGNITYSTTERTVKYTLINKTDEQTAGTDRYDEKKQLTASFSNIYTARGGSKTPNVPAGQEDPALTVTKTANGEYDDQTKSFDFYISFTYPTVEGVKVAPKDDKIITTGSSNGVTLTATTGEEVSKGQYKFSLRNGEKIAFVNLPAGTTYTITEAGDAQYKVLGLKVVSDGKENKDFENVAGAALARDFKVGENGDKGIVIGEKHNEIDFTNTRDSITITGVVTHSAPFVIMVGALFVAVGGYVVLKKRIEE